MERKRTPWMTAIGVLDIVLGASNGVLQAILLYGAIGINEAMETINVALGSTSERQFAPTRVLQLADRAEDEFREAELFILPDIITNLCMSMVLIVAGIATLRLAAWARPLSITWAALNLGWLVLLEVLEPVDFDSLGMLTLIYPAVLLYLFNTHAWRETFRRLPAA